MKRYEAASRFHLSPKQAVMIRVDGRAFHTYTKGMDKPFDHDMIKAMIWATEEVARDMSGFKLAYTQSDEASFLITDTDNFETQGWFDYNLAKVISISASTFTAAFNQYWLTHDVPPERLTKLATFDSRAFVVPMEDVPNCFLWRQKDWYRNSVQMLGQAHFSHKQLANKKLGDIHDMLHEKDINWAHLLPVEKNGTFIHREVRVTESDDQSTGFQNVYRTVTVLESIKADYQQIQDWIQNKENVDA